MTTRWAASLLLNDRAPHQVAMSLVTWVNNRLKPDQARHVVRHEPSELPGVPLDKAGPGEGREVLDP